MLKHPLQNPLTRNIGHDEFFFPRPETDQSWNNVQPLGHVPDAKVFAEHPSSEARLIELLDLLFAVGTLYQMNHGLLAVIPGPEGSNGITLGRHRSGGPFLP